MKKTIFGCLGVAAVAFALQFTMANVQAGLFSNCLPCDEVACSPCDDAACDPCDAVCGTKAGKWFINGHMEAGFFANEYGQKSTYAGNNWVLSRGADTLSGNTALLQNTRLTGAQINQVYVSTGKKVDGRHGLDIGGTVDFTWGSDAYVVQSAGMEYNTGHGTPGYSWGTGDYYAAFAQAYFEAEYGRWNVKAGKFYAPFGSSHCKSTENFFYSWAQSAFIVPHTASGMYATYKVNNRLSVLGGWIAPEEFGESGDNNAFLGGFTWTPGKRFSLSYTFASGTDKYGDGAYNRYWRSRGYTDKDEYFVHTLLATTQISSRLKYNFEWTLLNVNYSDGTGYEEHDAAYALNNEFIYQANKRWAFGARFGVLNISDVDWYTVSLGANWTPNKWLVVKPELRYDWVEKNTATPFNNYKGNGERDQLSGGMSAVVKF